MSLSKLSLAAGGLLQLFGAAEASPYPASRTTLVGRADDLLPEYDYIVVGGGTSGLTVADRLTENGRRMLQTDKS